MTRGGHNGVTTSACGSFDARLSLRGALNNYHSAGALLNSATTASSTAGSMSAAGHRHSEDKQGKEKQGQPTGKERKSKASLMRRGEERMRAGEER